MGLDCFVASDQFVVVCLDDLNGRVPFSILVCTPFSVNTVVDCHTVSAVAVLEDLYLLRTSLASGASQRKSWSSHLSALVFLIDLL